MPLSSLMVEGSLRTAQIRGCLRSRKSGCESRVCTLEGAIWEDFRKSHSSRGPGGTAPALQVGKAMLSLAFSFFVAPRPSQPCCRPVCPPQAAGISDSQHPFTPSPPHPPPVGGSQQGGNRPRTHIAIPSRSLSLYNHDASNPTPGYHSTGNPQKNPTLQARVERVKSLGRTRIWISTTDLYVSTGLELKRTNGTDETPNLGSAASSDCSQAMRQQSPSPTDTNPNANTSHHIPIFQAPCITISHQNNEIPLNFFSKQVAEKSISVYIKCNPQLPASVLTLF